MLGGLAACLICAAAVRFALADSGHPVQAGGLLHWGYAGAEGAEHWGELTPEFRSCSLGMEQTPIDLNGGIPAQACSEGLTWTVFKDPVTASAEQIKQFAALFPNNARPMQNRNRRYLLQGL